MQADGRRHSITFRAAPSPHGAKRGPFRCLMTRKAWCTGCLFDATNNRQFQDCTNNGLVAWIQGQTQRKARDPRRQGVASRRVAGRSLVRQRGEAGRATNKTSRRKRCGRVWRSPCRASVGPSIRFLRQDKDADARCRQLDPGKGKGSLAIRRIAESLLRAWRAGVAGMTGVLNRHIPGATLFQLGAEAAWLFVAAMLALRLDGHVQDPCRTLRLPAFVFAVLIVGLNGAFGLYRRDAKIPFRRAGGARLPRAR